MGGTIAIIFILGLGIGGLLTSIVYDEMKAIIDNLKLKIKIQDTDFNEFIIRRNRVEKELLNQIEVLIKENKSLKACVTEYQVELSVTQANDKCCKYQADEILRLAAENKQLKEHINHLQSCLDLEKVSDINE